jgi:formate hydrogenlyase subunit 3/multisubunit Na+/H+ antiporter MnhD subunit
LGLAAFLLSALLPLLLPRARGWAYRTALSASLIGAALLFVFSAAVLWSGVPEQFSLFSIASSLYFDFVIDRLAAFFIITITIVAFAAAIYSFGYIEHYPQRQRRNFLAGIMGLFVLSMILVVASKNLLSFLFFWELMAASSFLLVSFDNEKKETRKASLYYLVMTQLSMVFLLAAVCIIYSQTGSFDIQQASFASPLLLSLTFLFAFLAFGIKAGVVPFHKWLPYAHPAAPSNISALMSGLMIKVAIYGLVRFLLTILPPGAMWWGILILAVGTLSAILGVIYALKEHDIKRLLAYHSIENIGIILMGIGLYVIFMAAGFQQVALLALASALFHTLNHALFKSLLFLTAGSIANATKTMNIEKMGGLIARMPVTATLFLIGAISISALPPFNGFVSELMLFQAFFQAHLLTSPLMQIFLVAAFSIFALTSALAAACFVKAFSIIFLAVPRSKEAEEATEAPRSMLIGPAVLAVLCILLGIFSFQIFSMAGLDFSLPDLLLIGLLLLGVYLFAVLALMRVGKRRVSETWGCGYHLSGGKTEYTASGFSEPIIRIFDVVFRPRREVEREYHDDRKALFKQGNAEMKLARFFEEYLYNPVVWIVDKVSAFVARFQDADLDMYVSYLFITALAIIIAMRFLL